MLLQRRWRCRQTLFAVLLVVLSIPMTASGRQQRAVQSSDLGLEIIAPGGSRPLSRFAIRAGGGTILQRNRLKVSAPSVADEFTAIYVHAEPGSGAIRVVLSVIYDNLSNHEWWKQKEAKTVASYLIREGETVRPAELEQLGIEPFEMKVIDVKPVVLEPEERPRITNSTALEVERVERHLDSYRVWLKNKSGKNILAYTISCGDGTLSNGVVGYDKSRIVLTSGASSGEMHLYGSEIERNGMLVRLVVFEDGTFEGDLKSATQFLAKAEGVRIQSPSVLLMIERTLRIDDSDLRAAFDKLEADLWIIPEAIGKPSALQLLKTKYPAFDEKTRSELYEDLKGGLYDGRNIALAEIGDTRRRVQELEEHGQYASAVESIRRTLERLKQTFERITSTQR